MKRKAGIYIHIPFCKRKCFYCHFATVPFDSQLVNEYLNSVTNELRMKSNSGYVIDSIYVGGGSPSLLEGAHYFSLMESISKYYKVASNPEISIECNPEDISNEKLKIFKKAGFNRLSIGIQSFIEEDLNYLQRGHSVNQSLKAVSIALKHLFSNLNVDLIIGLPTQNEKSLDLNYSHVERFNLPHVSCYLLENVLPAHSSEECQYKLYNYTRKRLGAFDHYEVSNFCKPGFECRHNLKYWKNQEYIGIGLSASGFQDHKDYKNDDDFADYLKKTRQNILPVKEINSINPVSRKIVMGLRRLKGLPISSFHSYSKELAFLSDENLLIKVGDNMAVNPDKILLLNEILAYFV